MDNKEYLEYLKELFPDGPPDEGTIEDEYTKLGITRADF